MRIGKWQFDTENQVYMMGILNVTPDSFRMADVMIIWTGHCSMRRNW